MSRSEKEADIPVQSARKADHSSRSLRQAETRRRFSRKAGRLFILIGVPAVALLAAFLVYSHNPNLESRYYLPCFFHKLTGLYCPGCGNTRALYALLHLDFSGMLNNNALFPFLAVLLIWLTAGEYLKLLFGKRILWVPGKISPVVLAVMVLAVIAFTILRNLPIFPFSLLAPDA